MATAALLIWPFLSVCLFAFLGFKRGLVVSVIVGYLFLPTRFGIDFPGLPRLGKTSMIAIGALLGYLLFSGQTKKELSNIRMTDRMFVLCFFGLVILSLISPVLTALTNQEALFFGPTTLRGLSLQEAFRPMWRAFVSGVILFLGWRFLSSPSDHRLLLITLVGAALVYSVLAVFEMRMAPQLSHWIYDIRPDDFGQHVRNGAYRPIIFLTHGLAVGLFILTSAIASAALSRSAGARQASLFVFATLWLFAILILSRNFGATLLAALFVPIVFLIGSGWQVRIGAIIAAAFLIYPTLRQAGVVPYQYVLRIAEYFSANRAASFAYRLNSEEHLVERASLKPFFGWGGYGRSRIVNEFGKDVITPDGEWVITLGLYGWFGYLVLFGIIALPLFWLVKTRRRKAVPVVTTGMVLIVAANFIDLIPNSTLSPITLLMVGALAGFVTWDKSDQDNPDQDIPTPQRRTPGKLRYSRFGS